MRDRVRAVITPTSASSRRSASATTRSTTVRNSGLPDRQVARLPHRARHEVCRVLRPLDAGVALVYGLLEDLGGDVAAGPAQRGDRGVDGALRDPGRVGVLGQGL